jgi:superfamily II DNA or RNA helicase
MSKRGEQYLLIKSPPASGKSRALMFIALDKLAQSGLKQAIIVVPEKSIGASFNDEPLSSLGFGPTGRSPALEPVQRARVGQWRQGQSVGAFLASDDKVLVCTHATFRFAVDRFGVEAFDDRLIAVDEFHHVSANPDNKLGLHLGQFIARDRVHVVAMTGSYFRGDAEAVLAPQDEAKFDTVTYTYYEQLNGYEYLKRLDIGYFFYSGSYADDILKVLDPAEKDHRPHPQRQFAREHEGQDQGGRAHHRGTGRLAGNRPRDRLPVGQDARGRTSASPTWWMTTCQAGPVRPR